MVSHIRVRPGLSRRDFQSWSRTDRHRCPCLCVQ
ncbi:uncharacterized protein ARMOST_00002 [Armillaria ostoyae]|uniref:Uncharacterized protein n=1 Tax=Armillaria ostoyae TaxID=47428 RepID=A0A284QJX6_ARMOS|nr:uncharacterized protein ARMOST_00002 [Armillaria ostoyae]